jgi:hypothetical protein
MGRTDKADGMIASSNAVFASGGFLELASLRARVSPAVHFLTLALLTAA